MILRKRTIPTYLFLITKGVVFDRFFYECSGTLSLEPVKASIGRGGTGKKEGQEGVQRRGLQGKEGVRRHIPAEEVS